MSTLATEFTTSRLLQTVYGTSNIVWANVIGLVMLFLTLGYFLGGKLADKRPFPTTFYTLVTITGAASIFFLLLTSVLLKVASAAIFGMNGGLIAGSLVGVMMALAIPVTLLGCMSPFAIRLAVRDVDEAGRISGRIYATSTMGSLLGTYLPVLWVIPTYGSRITAVIFGTLLLLIGLGGLWQINRKKSLIPLALSLFLIPIAAFWTGGTLKAYEGQIFETESPYNYIQVIRREDCNYLLLNEGQAFHSFYCDNGRIPRISVWSIMLAAPYFNETVDNIETMAVIGLAAGTIPKQYIRVYEKIAIDGIELDPAIAQAGREYFAMNDPQLNVIIGDGRFELNQLDGRYDIITLDAYKVPYIPWHLTTRQFFEEIAAHLNDDGVLAMNVGRAPQDRRLVDALTATLQTVYPTVHAIDVPRSLNTILIATMEPTDASNLLNNSAALSGDTDPLLKEVLQTAVTNLAPLSPSALIFTDERAPVETLIDSLVIRYVLREGVSGLGGLE